ncbi:MAG TPA: DUF192 domain-containing protein [Candidatus Paceibacterota bacterium]|jgi:uncharacterized membrane protein (UPF0127 family)|nr:DUF192 domain-containing protein [Candidatus Paceibacterota bacterium]
MIKNFKKNYIIVGGAILILILALVNHRNTPAVVDISSVGAVRIAGETVNVDLALDQSTQERGLSGRDGLSPDQGMLFVFNSPAKYGFWMKDMNFPIDIIWLSADKRVVYIEKSAEPASYPEIFTPPEDALYVLEVISGFSEKNNLSAGDQAEFLSSK